MSLIQMGLSAGALIALTAALRLAAAGRLPRRAYVALWDLAALRLLIPLSVPWRFSPRALLRAGPPALAAQATAVQAARALPVAGAALSGAAPAGAAAAAGWLLPALRAVWVVGMLALCAHFVRVYAVSLRAFACALPDEDPRTAAFLRAHPLALRRVRVRVSGAIGAPLSYGVLRPVILLPTGMPREGLEHVLAHELWHIRALDAVRKLALVACVCVHWMNPLVWVMFLLANRDMELLCDARVLARMGRTQRRDYARTLLDLEERRSCPSPLASGFSRTAIEERIKAMYHMKKTGAAAALLSALLVLGAGVALATDAPQISVRTINGSSLAVSARPVPAEAKEAAGAPVISPETWAQHYAQYAPFGLSLGEGGRLMFAGKTVRCFEDMYPAGTDGMAGICLQFTDGEIDVYAVRDLSGPIVRRADGSFDPSGVLTGLRAATQAEFDARTARIREADQRAVTIVYDAADGGEAISTVTLTGTEADDFAYTVEEAGDAVYTIRLEDALSGAQQPEIVWWTAEEYAAWMEQERIAMQALVDEGVRGWTNSDGWFTWTQEKLDEVMARYQQTLEAIRGGLLVSRTVDGADDVVISRSMPGDGEEAVSLLIAREPSEAAQPAQGTDN